MKDFDPRPDTVLIPYDVWVDLTPALFDQRHVAYEAWKALIGGRWTEYDKQRALLTEALAKWDAVRAQEPPLKKG